MALEPIRKAIDLALENLSEEELLELNRRFRLFRFCIMSVLISSISLISSLFGQNILTHSHEIYIDGSNIGDWHYFQYLFTVTLLIPIVIIFYLASAIISIETTNQIRNKVQSTVVSVWKNKSTWIESAILLISLTTIAVFWKDIAFSIS